MKKALITCLLIISMVLIFQTCGTGSSSDDDSDTSDTTVVTTESSSTFTLKGSAGN